MHPMSNVLDWHAHADGTSALRPALVFERYAISCDGLSVPHSTMKDSDQAFLVKAVGAEAHDLDAKGVTPQGQLAYTSGLTKAGVYRYMPSPQRAALTACSIPVQMCCDLFLSLPT